MQFPPLTPVARALMVIAVLGFAAIALTANLTTFPLAELLALDGGHLSLATAWQVVTYSIVEPPVETSIVWLGISLLFIWLIAAPFELRHGPRRTWLGMGVLTLAGGLGGVAAGLVARLAGFPGGLVFGLGAPTFGLLVAGVFGSGAPMVQLFGRVPLSRAQVAWLLVALSVFQFGAFARDAAMLGADLASIGAGVLYGQWLLRPARPSRPKPRRSAPHLRAIQGGRADDDGDAEDEKPRWLN